MPRLARLLLVASGAALLSCRALLGIEDDVPLLAPDVVDASGGFDAPADAASGSTLGDAESPKADGGAHDSDAGDPLAALGRGLAQKRVRFADSAREWFVGQNRVYARDDLFRVHGYRPPSTARVDYTFSTPANVRVSGNDDYVVLWDHNVVAAYAAAQPEQLIASIAKTGAWTDIVPTSTSVTIVQVTGGDADRDLLVWNPKATAAPVKIMSLGVRGGIDLKRVQRDRLYLFEFGTAKAWTIDTSEKTAGAIELDHLPTALDAANGGVIYEYVNAGVVAYELSVAGQPARNIMEEIKAADSIVPVSLRVSLSSFSQYGDWLIYAAAGGNILAFDLARRRLVPCQLREPGTDEYFRQPKVIVDAGLLVFAREGSSDPGLYSLRLADVLPR